MQKKDHSKGVMFGGRNMSHRRAAVWLKGQHNQLDGLLDQLAEISAAGAPFPQTYIGSFIGDKNEISGLCFFTLDFNTCAQYKANFDSDFFYFSKKKHADYSKTIDLPLIKKIKRNSALIFSNLFQTKMGSIQSYFESCKSKREECMPKKYDPVSLIILNICTLFVRCLRRICMLYVKAQFMQNREFIKGRIFKYSNLFGMSPVSGALPVGQTIVNGIFFCQFRKSGELESVLEFASQELSRQF